MFYKKVRPTERKSFLLNPHKGIATFNRYDSDPPDPPEKRLFAGMDKFPPELSEGALHYLPSTVAYFRWYWYQFQPEVDRFDWSMVDEALEGSAAHGQTLQIRLMPHGTRQHGKLPKWYEQRYTTVPGTQKRYPYTAAIYDSDEYIETWGNVIRAFGDRYDGHPTLESVDISFIGPWGEGAGDCSDEGIDRMTAIYRQAHTKTPLVTMITGYKMTAGIRAGAGWRCDCYGDLRQWHNPDVPEGIGENWNHHYDRYPMAVCECGAQEAWKTAPVVFETASVPMGWYASGFDLDFIIQQGLKYHGSVFMAKSGALPVPWLDKFEKLCNDIGYRFVLRQFQSELPARIGKSFEYTCWIENMGVAPLYRSYTFAVRMKQGQKTELFISDANPRQWLPGDVFLRERIPVPENFEPGKVELSAALVHPETHEPHIRFAVEESDPEGWVPLGTIEIEKPN